MPKITVHEIRAAKGNRQLTEIFTMDPVEAAAANAAGIDFIVTLAGNVPSIRAAAPDVFLIGATTANAKYSDADAIRDAVSVMDKGADGIYTGTSFDRVRAISKEWIPVFGHVGLVPYRNTYVGGMRAVGKTVDEAMDVYETTKGYEDAGAIGVEMEVVPHQIASEISKRTSICVISMGSGDGCDAQYLFAEDILGTNTGHVPRHAKQYANLAPKLDALQQERIKAFTSFKNDVQSGAYPEAGHQVNAKPEVLEGFLNQLPSA